MALIVSVSFAQYKTAVVKKQKAPISATNRTIVGSITSTSFYVPSTTHDLTFSIDVTSADWEYVDYVELTFPAGITPNSGDADLAGGAINAVAGQVISWGDNNNSFGDMATPVSATFNVNVTVGAITGDQTINYAISGDLYGGEPHEIAGTIVISEMPACVFPNNLSVSNFTPTSATLNWNEQGTATLWNIEWGAAGFTQGTGTAVNGLLVDTLDISGLSAGTFYDFYVQADCGGSTSSWAGPFNFATPNCELVDQCQYRFNVIDEYGQGDDWNGAYITVYEEGIEVATIEHDGSGTAQPTAIDVYVAFCTGMNVTLEWHKGSYDGECALEVYDPFGTVLYSFTGDAGNGGEAMAFTEGQIINSFTTSCTPPTCPAPTGLAAAATDVNASLSWVEAGSATEWEVEYGADGFAHGAGTIVNVTTTATTDIASLTSSTDYAFYVRAICGVGDTSFWVGPYAFSTTCASYSLPFTEDFEGTIDCWSAVDNDGDTYNWGLVSGGSPAHSGTGIVTSASYDNSAGALTPENWLISPAIDLSTATGSGALTLNYWVGAVDQSWPSENYKVVVSTTGASSLANFTDLLLEEIIDAGLVADSFFLERTLNLDAYAGEVINIAWVHYNCTDMYQIKLDDIMVFENADVDVAVDALVAPTNATGCTKTNTETVTAKLLNLGGADISNFDVSLYLDGVPVVTETVTDVIAPAASLNYTFGTTIDLSTFAYYEVKVTVAVAGDIDASNDELIEEVRSTDGVINVTVVADNQSGQAWYILNSTNDTVATHGAYQWNVTVSNDVCVLSDDCYTFEWLYSDAGTNDLTVSYNSVVEESLTVTANYTIAMIGTCPDNVESVENDILSVYPNPTTGVVNIETTANSTISIYNIIGEEVVKVNTTGTRTIVDMSNLSQGTYMIKVVSEDSNITTKKINLIK